MSSETALEAREIKAIKASAHQVIVIGDDDDKNSPPAVRIELADVSELHEDEDNARRGNVDVIDSSLSEFGQHRFVVAQRDGRIVVGNHLYRTALQRDWNKIFVQWVDDDYEKGTRRGLADNATGDLAEWDTDALLALHDKIGIENVAGFSAESLDEMRRINAREHKRAERQGVDQSDDLDDAFSVLLICTSEEHQAELLQRFEKEGLSCRALIS
jgi:hypothetical protein